jgi:hypothetical protein
VVEIEYHCPTHGKVEVHRLTDDDTPLCPLTLRRVVDGKLVVEPCGQPLTAYMG